MARESTRTQYTAKVKLTDMEESDQVTPKNQAERRNSEYTPRLSLDHDLVTKINSMADPKLRHSVTTPVGTGSAASIYLQVAATTRLFGSKELTASASPSEFHKSRLANQTTPNKQIRFVDDDRFVYTNLNTKVNSENSDLETLLSSGIICKDDVCKGLELKSNVSKSKKNKITPDSSQTFLLQSGSSSRDSSEEIPANVMFTGRIATAGESRLVSLVTKPASTAVHPCTPDTGPSNSLICNVGVSKSFMTLDVWPWPWLDPSKTSEEKYVGADHKTFTRESELMHAEPPILAVTLKGYLDSLEPCMTAGQFEYAKKIVKDFALCKGKTLAEVFLKKVEGSSPWQRGALPNYDFRLSRHEQVLETIAIVVPFCDDLWPPKANTQIDRSVELITMTLEFFRLVAKEKLKPLCDQNNKPLCMHSFRKLFSSSRIPGLVKDRVESYFYINETGNTRPTHIVIIYKGTFFYLTVMDTEYKIIKPSLLKAELIKIKNKYHRGNGDGGSPIGVLTSTHRDVWHVYREKLIALDTSNAENLRIIDEALFILSLDDVSVCLSALSHEAVFADGCNRWYDKSLSFYVYENGLITCSANVACQDGWAVAVLLDFIHLRILEDRQKWDDDVVKTVVSKLSVSASPVRSRNRSDQLDITYKYSAKSYSNVKEAQEFKFTLNEDLRDEIRNAIFRFVNLQEEFLTAQCEYTSFKDDMFKRNKLPPTAFAHLLIHLSFFRMYYRMAFIGSKIQTKAFYHGRYEYLRSTTREVRDWCKAMLEQDVSKAERTKLFWCAVKKHMQLYHRCIAGQSCDSHLTALKLICLETDGKLPDLFSDKMLLSYDRFEVYVENLGASFLSRKVVLPRQRKGYGLGYTLVNSRLVCVVSSWADEITTSAELFAATIKATIEAHHDFFDDL